VIAGLLANIGTQNHEVRNADNHPTATAGDLIRVRPSAIVGTSTAGGQIPAALNVGTRNTLTNILVEVIHEVAAITARLMTNDKRSSSRLRRRS